MKRMKLNRRGMTTIGGMWQQISDKASELTLRPVVHHGGVDSAVSPERAGGPREFFRPPGPSKALILKRIAGGLKEH